MTLPSNEKLSPNFYYSELVDSETASRKKLNNIPPVSVYLVALQTAQKMELVRNLIGHPIRVNSWYRSPEVNVAVGGSATSQHCEGEAIDFTSRGFGTPQEICVHLAKHAEILQFDQLIFEHTWVHISFNFTKKRPARKQILTLLSSGKYAKGITDKSGNPLYTGYR